MVHIQFQMSLQVLLLTKRKTKQTKKLTKEAAEKVL